jgi:glycogen(starch) synthase
LKRLLMTADAVGGVWTYSTDLARGLGRLGIEVHVATMGPRPNPAQRRAAEEAGIRLWESDYALEWADDPWAEVQEAGDWLLDLAKVIEPDRVHLNGYAHGALPWSVPVVVVAHSCVLSWFWAVHGQPAPPRWSTYAGVVAAGLEGADAVVAPTAAMAGELARWYGFDRSVVIANGRNADWIRPRAKRPLVLGAGRVWDEAKNLTALARVAPRLDWPVAIAGEGPKGEDGGSDPVRFLGPLDFSELSSWLLSAALFVSPTRYEPFGLGILEAAQAGCALVLGSVASLVELWEGAAEFVDPADDDALASACQRLIGDGDLRRRMSDAARRRSEDFGLCLAAQAYLDLYLRLADRPPMEDRI